MPLAILILLNSYLAMSKDWWTIPREEGLTHVSYVASSEGEAPLEELKEKAFMTAATIIVREHFGTTVEASESVIEETGNSKYQFLTKLKSDPMIIKGLKLTDIKVLESGKVTRVLVRVSISKDDLAQAIKSQNRDQIENIYGRGKGDNYVAVKTIPQGALIQITGIDKRYFVQGHGDAKFYLPLGEYNITIMEEGYGAITKAFKIFHRNEDLSFELEPILGKLSIKTDPDDAVITPMNSVKGDNPFYLRPHKKYRFRVSHPDYFEEEFEYSLSDDRDYFKPIKLQRLSSSFRFRITPEPSLVSINKKHYKNGERISIEDEEMHIIIEAKGYERFEKWIVIKPNRYYPDEFIKLHPKKESPPFKWPKLPSFDFFKNEPMRKRFEYNPYVQLDGKGDFSIIPLSFFIERGFISAGLSYNYIDSYHDDGEKSVQKSISDFSLNLRLSYREFGNLVPYIALTSGSYKVDQTTDDLENLNEENKSFSYHGVGGGLRYYFSNGTSIHGEMIHIKKDLKDGENLKPNESYDSSEVKALIGLGWEF